MIDLKTWPECVWDVRDQNWIHKWLRNMVFAMAPGIFTRFTGYWVVSHGTQHSFKIKAEPVITDITLHIYVTRIPNSPLQEAPQKSRNVGIACTVVTPPLVRLRLRLHETAMLPSGNRLNWSLWKRLHIDSAVDGTIGVTCKWTLRILLHNVAMAPAPVLSTALILSMAPLPYRVNKP